MRTVSPGTVSIVDPRLLCPTTQHIETFSVAVKKGVVSPFLLLPCSPKQWLVMEGRTTVNPWGQKDHLSA